MSERGGILVQERLFDASLPEAFGSTLDALVELDALTQARTAMRKERVDAAAALHERLVAGAAVLAEPTAADLGADTADYRSWFTEAVILWTHLADTNAPIRVDSLGTHTLGAFPLDLPPDGDAAARVRAAARVAFGWADAPFADVERGIDHVISNLSLKRAIARQLAEELTANGGPAPARRVELMRALYGDVPWQPGDVDAIIAATNVFLCIPRKGIALEKPDFDRRPEPDRRSIAEFLTRLNAANLAETKRFPAFGFFDEAKVAPALLDRLTDALAVPRAAVLATLATMVVVLPTQHVDQYLVHDAWGHTWQEALTEFEWEYVFLPKLDAPLGPDDGPEFGGAATALLAEAFVADGGRTRLDEGALLRFAEADLRGRIRVGTSAALSETLADFMECKYARAHPEAPLPSTSLLPPAALKLDLSVGDVRRQVQRLSEPYRKLAVDATTRAALAAALAARGAPEAGLADAVARAGRAMWHAFAPAFDVSLRAEPAPGGASGGLRSSVFRRMMLKFLQLSMACEDALVRRTGNAPDAFRDPFACPDFFAVALARFYEQDRAKNFWHLDQVARTELEPGCARLRAALAGQG